MTLTTKPHFKKVALIGIGLIGSSIARALQQHKLADEIVCAARTLATRRTALELGIVSAARRSEWQSSVRRRARWTPSRIHVRCAESARFGEHRRPGRSPEEE